MKTAFRELLGFNQDLDPRTTKMLLWIFAVALLIYTLGAVKRGEINVKSVPYNKENKRVKYYNSLKIKL